MNRLSRAIDGPVGIDHRLTRLPLPCIIKGITGKTILIRTSLVCICIGKDLISPALAVEDTLTFRVGSQVMGLLGSQTRIDTNPHLGVGDGLSGRGLHHHNTHVIVRL